MPESRLTFPRQAPCTHQPWPTSHVGPSLQNAGSAQINALACLLLSGQPPAPTSGLMQQCARLQAEACLFLSSQLFVHSPHVGLLAVSLGSALSTPALQLPANHAEPYHLPAGEHQNGDWQHRATWQWVQAGVSMPQGAVRQFVMLVTCFQCFHKVSSTRDAKLSSAI